MYGTPGRFGYCLMLVDVNPYMGSALDFIIPETFNDLLIFTSTTPVFPSILASAIPHMALEGQPCKNKVSVLIGIPLSLMSLSWQSLLPDNPHPSHWQPKAK